MFKMLSTLAIAGLALGFTARPAEATPRDIVRLEHLYLRCGSTDWNLSEQSLLRPDATRSHFTLDFTVAEPWMQTSGDTCILTASAQLHVWGPDREEFTLQKPIVDLPDSSHLVRLAADQQRTFIMRVPALGRYRATYSPAEGYLSFRKLGPTAAGEVSWSRPGQLTQDAAGDLYIADSTGEPSLYRVRASDGSTMWSRIDADLQPTCSRRGTVYALEASTLLALDATTGQLRWRRDFTAAGDHAARLVCPSDSDLLFITHGPEHSILSAFARGQGELVWSYQAGPYLNIQTSDAKTLYVAQSYRRLSAVSIDEGQELWSRSIEGSTLHVAPGPDLYLMSGARLQRLDTTSGQDLWTYTSTAEWFYLTAQPGRLLIQDRHGMARLDPAKGTTLWTYSFSTFEAGLATAKVFAQGEILLQGRDKASLVEQTVLLDGASGQRLWGERSSFFVEATAGSSFELAGDTLSAIDLRSGQARWSYQHRATARDEKLFANFDEDGEQVFATFGIAAARYPAMGMLALDAATGELRWKNFQNAPLRLVAQDKKRIFVSVGADAGTVKAILK